MLYFPKTDRDLRVVYEEAEFQRLCMVLYVGRAIRVLGIVLFVLVAIAVIRFVAAGETMQSVSFVAMVVVVLISCILMGLADLLTKEFKPPITRRRRIYDAVDELISALNHYLGPELDKSGESRLFGNETFGSVKVTRRDNGAWLIQMFNPDTSVDQEPSFAFVVSKYRMVNPEMPEDIILYGDYAMEALSIVTGIVTSQSEQAWHSRTFGLQSPTNISALHGMVIERPASRGGKSTEMPS